MTEGKTEASHADGQNPGASRRRPTINDVARLAGVSKKTVSRVINQSPLVTDDTRHRVEVAIRETGFVPDPQARALALGRSLLVGLIYDNPNAQFVVNAQSGVLDGLRGSGVELVVHPCDRRSPALLDEVRAFVERQRLLGVVLLPPVSEDEALVDVLRDLGCPYVRIASAELDRGDRMVASNDQVGTAEAAAHLIDLGHRRIACIRGPSGHRSAQERWSGFIAALAEQRVTLPSEYVVEGGYTFESGVVCAEHLLSLEPCPTAIFAANDEMAAGVYQVAHQRGLRIPEDLSVVGFDDTPLAARMWPPLTTLSLPIREVGRLAATLLLAQSLPVGEPSGARPIEPQLVVRSSTAPPA